MSTSLFDNGGSLWAKTRSPRKDSALRRWVEATGHWVEVKDEPAFQIAVGDGILSHENGRAFWNGELIETNTAVDANIRELYFAKGCLLFRSVDPDKSNDLTALPWTGGVKSAAAEKRISLRSDNEFVYSWGQHQGDVLAATNTGGVYCFDGDSWIVILEPEKGTSFQIYSMISFYDSLLLGHYPSGELWEYSDRRLHRRTGWPPVMNGVSNRAREAQTTGIYGGQLLTGVWPWGEVWRYDKSGDQWHLLQRLFSHPPLSDEIVHPWEKEMEIAAPEAARNLWGHRIMAMVPIDNSIYISTAAKQAIADPKKFKFIQKPEIVQEYGAVYRVTLPGQQTVETNWKDDLTTFEFVFNDGDLIVNQDEKELGRVEAKLPEFSKDYQTLSGQGIFGTGENKDLRVTVESPKD